MRPSLRVDRVEYSDGDVEDVLVCPTTGRCLTVGSLVSYQKQSGHYVTARITGHVGWLVTLADGTSQPPERLVVA